MVIRKPKRAIVEVTWEYNWEKCTDSLVMKKKTTNKVLRKFTDERGELFTMLFFYLIFYGSLIFLPTFLLRNSLFSY